MTLRQQFDKAISAHNYDDALAMLDEAVPADTHPVLHFQRSAQIHEKLGDLDAAAKDYSILLDNHPTNAKLWDQAGRFYYRIGKNEEAASHLEAANKLSDGKIGCKKTLTAAYRRAGNDSKISDMITAMEADENLSGEDLILLAELMLSNAQRLSEAKAYFEQGYAKAPSTEKLIRQYANFMFKTAHQGLKRKKWDLALSAFESGLGADPANYKQHIYYTNLLISLDKYEDAKAAIAAADGLASKDGLDYQAAMNRTQIYEKLGDIDGAKAAYSKLIETSPEDPKAWDQAGRFYFRQGVNEQAVSHIEKALELSKGAIGCKKTLIAAMRRLGVKTDVEKSIESFKSQKNKTPADYYTIADILAGDSLTFDQARAYFEKGLAMEEPSAANQKKYAALLNKVAQQANRKGDWDMARENYQAGLDVEPDNYRNILRFVAFLVKQEAFDEAKDLIKRAQKLAAKNDYDHLPYLGLTEMRMGNPEAAKKAFLKSYRKDPRHEEANLMRLADTETALGNHKSAVSYLKKLNELNGSRVANRERRMHIHNLLQGKYNAQDKKRMATCVTYFQRNLPKLDHEQQRILDEIIDRGICMTDFDSLFGAQHQDLWDKAEKFVQNFVNDPETKALEKRITECEDFNADPEFAGSFKPSIINYRLLKGEMYATEAAYQLYLNKRILDITNSYHEMLSKIRNVALWVNPPIGGKNIGERKGSQIWHRDQEDANILKCFIYYSDIDESSGATEYIPYSKVKPTRKYSDVLAYPNSSGYPGKFLIDTRIDPKDMLKAEGKKKSIMFFDTNGFHRGGYVTGDKRILTMATFLRPITPYADTNTKLSMEGFNEDDYPFEAVYGVKK